MTLSQIYAAVGLDSPPDVESWKTDVSVFLQLQQDEEESGWKIATHAAHMLAKYGRGAATKLSREAAVSASYIRSLAITVRVFPEGVRNPALSTTHHRIAAQTQSPKVWLQRAAENKWSVRQLQEAIKGKRLNDEYQAHVDRLENNVRKFNETWGARKNVEAVLVLRNVREISA